MRSALKIFILSWNTQSKPYSETTDEQQFHANRCGINEYLFPRIFLGPDFIPAWMELIAEHEPDVVVIGLQEDRKPGSYLQSHVLPQELKKHGYECLSRTRGMGLGSTSWKSLWNMDVHMRGLRSSIYVKTAMYPHCTLQEEYYFPTLMRNKGAIAIHLDIGGRGCTFINCHLPFDSENLLISSQRNNPVLRQNVLNYSNIYYNECLDKFVKIGCPFFIFGDMNYRVNAMLPDYEPETLYSYYQNHDELYLQMKKENIYRLSEGVNNMGPCFAPTCKLKVLREAGSYDYRTGRFQQRNPSWADRILYSNLLNCIKYDRLDVGNMVHSDHCAVYGVYNLT